MARTTASDVLPIQCAVASASPSRWADALVVSAADGVIEIVTLDGASQRLVSGAAVRVGDPVSHHPVAELLAAGTARWSARAELAA